MRNSFLARVGSPSMERLGAAPHAAELRGLAQDGATLYEVPASIG